MLICCALLIEHMLICYTADSTHFMLPNADSDSTHVNLLSTTGSTHVNLLSAADSTYVNLLCTADSTHVNMLSTADSTQYSIYCCVLRAQINHNYLSNETITLVNMQIVW